MINFYPLARGVASYFLPKAIFRRPGSGGTFSAAYCYSVWLRHLHYLIHNGLISSTDQLKTVAEIGPGDSLGIGLSALLTGSEKYFAFDVIEHANKKGNIGVANELCELFIRSAEIPHDEKFKNVFPALPNYTFPKEIVRFNEQYYDDRRSKITLALRNGECDLKIKYIVPWDKKKNVDIDNVDLIFSQAVMEHVADIEFAYQAMYKWLRKGGIISHQIDFEKHEMAKEWNGHWYIGAEMWNILAHGRKYPMNRLPLSAHLNAMKNAGFTIKFVLPVEKENTFQIHPKVPNVAFTDSDLITSGALVQAIK
jgi:SAM-dependent methyltransferase